MGTIRFFSGGRDPGKKSVASEIMRLEMQKQGKMDSAARFKFIMKRKMEEQRKTMHQTQVKHGHSKKAETALKQIAQKKAAKEAKKMRQMVIVAPRNFSNGRLTKKGKFFDTEGNMVGQVNIKNGKISTTMGTSLGQYKPKSKFVDGVFVDAINKYSPYFINLRKMQALQAAGIDPVTGQPKDANVINVHGNFAAMHGAGYIPPSQSGLGGVFGQGGGESHQHASFDNTYGEAAGGPRQNIGVTAFGAVSDNVWGVFADNAWGVSTDNAWGTNSTDVWGGVGGTPFGGKGVQMWGTGNGKNYIKAITNAIKKLFGSPNRQTVQAFNAFKAAQQGRTARGARTSGGPRAGGAPTARAPAGRR